MAEENDDDLILQPADAGAAFRFEMAATNFFLGYWKHMLAVLVVVLVSLLIYGQYRDYYQSVQRGAAARIADVERELPAPIALLAFQKSQGALTATDDALIQAAEQLEAIAGAVSGTAAVEARLKAAELYRLAGSVDARRAVLEATLGEARGVLEYAAESALAAMDLEAGRGDEAVRRYRTLAAEHDGFLAQQATIELGLALEHLGRREEAAQVYGEFLSKWPDAPRASEVRNFQSRVRGAAG